MFTTDQTRKRGEPTPAPTTRKRKPETDAQKADKAKRRQAAWRDRYHREAEAGREIGPLPAIKNKKRRQQCEADLERALRIYFPRRFSLPFSRDHKKVIESIEQAAREGLLLAVAMPRGSGKTTICESAAILVVLFGWHKYVAIVAATQQHAKKRIESIKGELRANPKLLADFPEAVYPIRQLNNITQRARGQRLANVPTNILWEAERVVLPTVEGSPSSGGCLESAGLIGAVRGMALGTDGEIRRPTFCLVDDPQTRRSARSATQTDERVRVINSEILYLSGPGERRISCVMPCTVIEPGDLADQFLDREKHPEWRGITTQMLDSMPIDTELWDQYAQLRHEELVDGGTGKKARAFYKKNRKAMDAGAVVAWPERIEEGDLSALQSAMDRYYRDREAFFAEFQNDPAAAHRSTATDELAPARISAKLGTWPRGVVDPSAIATTAFIDVQKEALYYCVCAWSERMTGQVVEYGTWPEQPGQYHTLANLRRTLSKKYPGRQLEGRLRGGLDDLAADLSSRYTIARGLVDAAWGLSRDTVYDFCTRNASIWWPYHGRYIGPGRRPMREWTTAAGDLPTALARRSSAEAAHWRSPRPEPRVCRHVLSDVNWWKSYTMNRLAAAIGDPGSLSLYQPEGAENHRLYAEHLTAESKVETSGPFGVVDDWRLNPGRPDNHWLDCTVGATVAASICGLSLDYDRPAPVTRKRRRSVTQL